MLLRFFRFPGIVALVFELSTACLMRRCDLLSCVCRIAVYRCVDSAVAVQRRRNCTNGRSSSIVRRAHVIIAFRPRSDVGPPVSSSRYLRAMSTRPPAKMENGLPDILAAHIICQMHGFGSHDAIS